MPSALVDNATSAPPAVRVSDAALRDAVRERLSSSSDADPRAIVEALLVDLSDDEVLAAARKGLSELAQEVVRADRRRSTAPAATGSKWDAVTAARAARPDVFDRRVFAGSLGWVFLGDCTVDHLAEASVVAREQAQGLEGAADRYDRLRSALAGLERVRDLDRSDVEAILNA